jgi:membrane protein YdbS with pleckstrin-like domain
MRRMGYVDQNLIHGEAVQYRAPLHWKVMIVPVLLCAAAVALAILAFRQAGSSPDNASIFKIAGAVFLVLAVIPIVRARIVVSSSEFAVTNKRVILKTGFVRSHTAEMFLAKVESVGVDQTVLGRVMGYGSIVIRGTGGSLEPFSGIARPLEFRRQIQEQIGRSMERPTERPSSSQN